MMPVKRLVPFSTPDDQMSKASKITYRNTPSPTNSQSGSQPSSPLTLNETSASQIEYADRSGSGNSIVKLNPTLEMREKFEKSETKPLGMRCKLVDDPDDFNNKMKRYRYMYTTLDERARALEEHFFDMQEKMCEAEGLNSDNLTPVGLPSQDDVWVCGRICNDSSEGKINSKSVLLEGSKEDSSGRRVQLDLQEMPGYSLFPGQIVLVQGTNSTGRRMLARKIIEGVMPTLPTTTPMKLLEYHHSTRYQGGKILFFLFLNS